MLCAQVARGILQEGDQSLAHFRAAACAWLDTPISTLFRAWREVVDRARFARVARGFRTKRVLATHLCAWARVVRDKREKALSTVQKLQLTHPRNPQLVANFLESQGGFLQAKLARRRQIRLICLIYPASPNNPCRQQHRAAAVLARQAVLGPPFAAWAQAAAVKLHERALREKIELRLRHRSLRVATATWKRFTALSQRARASRRLGEEARVLLLTRRCFDAWQRAQTKEFRLQRAREQAEASSRGLGHKRDGKNVSAVGALKMLAQSAASLTPQLPRAPVHLGDVTLAGLHGQRSMRHELDFQLGSGTKEWKLEPAPGDVDVNSSRLSRRPSLAGVASLQAIVNASFAPLFDPGTRASLSLNSSSTKTGTGVGDGFRLGSNASAPFGSPLPFVAPVGDRSVALSPLSSPLPSPNPRSRSRSPPTPIPVGMSGNVGSGSVLDTSGRTSVGLASVGVSDAKARAKSPARSDSRNSSLRSEGSLRSTHALQAIDRSMGSTHVSFSQGSRAKAGAGTGSGSGGSFSTVRGLGSERQLSESAGANSGSEEESSTQMTALGDAVKPM
jgi:hypothetical protein